MTFVYIILWYVWHKWDCFILTSSVTEEKIEEDGGAEKSDEDETQDDEWCVGCEWELK